MSALDAREPLVGVQQVGGVGRDVAVDDREARLGEDQLEAREQVQARVARPPEAHRTREVDRLDVHPQRRGWCLRTTGRRVV